MTAVLQLHSQLHLLHTVQSNIYLYLQSNTYIFIYPAVVVRGICQRVEYIILHFGIYKYI